MCARSTPSRRPPFWRGAAGALALAAWTVAGVVWAALALAPVALERGPRGRARARPLLGGRAPRPLVAGPDAPPQTEPVPAARAAGEAVPG